jgi:hypothetical protein
MTLFRPSGSDWFHRRKEAPLPSYFAFRLKYSLASFLDSEIQPLMVYLSFSSSALFIQLSTVPSSSTRKPRQEISKSAQKCLNKTPLKVSITFD